MNQEIGNIEAIMLAVIEGYKIKHKSFKEGERIEYVNKEFVKNDGTIYPQYHLANLTGDDAWGWSVIKE